MSLEQWSYVAQILGTLGVVLSLLFVGLQIRQNTSALQRNEHNSTMAQWTVIRQAIATNREIAELMTAGLSGASSLDVADQARLDNMLQEMAWASFHIWDRTQRGVFPPGTFEFSCGALLGDVLRTTRGQEWWSRAKGVGFVPPYVAAVDAMLAVAQRKADAP